jgi:hypothetical protein
MVSFLFSSFLFPLLRLLSASERSSLPTPGFPPSLAPTAIAICTPPPPPPPGFTPRPPSALDWHTSIHPPISRRFASLASRALACFACSARPTPSGRYPRPSPSPGAPPVPRAARSPQQAPSRIPSRLRPLYRAQRGLSPAYTWRAAAGWLFDRAAQRAREPQRMRELCSGTGTGTGTRTGTGTVEWDELAGAHTDADADADTRPALLASLCSARAAPARGRPSGADSRNHTHMNHCRRFPSYRTRPVPSPENAPRHLHVHTPLPRRATY